MDDEAVAELVDRAWVFVCARRVSDFVDLPGIMAGVDATVTPDRVGRFVARFVAPARDRLLARFRGSQLRLGVWLPDATRDALAQLLREPVVIPKQVIDEFVASDEVRDQVREVLQEAISGILAKAMKSPLGLGARLLGGMGDKIAAQLEERIVQFLDIGVGIAQRRLAVRLASPETARALGKRRRRGFLALLKRKEGESADWIARVPHALLDAMTPAIVTHNVTRPEVRDLLQTEIAAVLDELANQTIGELLDDFGLRDLARADFRQRGFVLVREFLASP